ncbi:unnamed protein product [Linum tenue]|uniref:Secreted protein n=1 Tax=Linum tenue TaxID=586396 RepID=A0AAV0JXZ1_9ROSI|nr:unnamed protein product [Linum tenue]
MGMLRLIPKMLALIAVQRQSAASRSTSPSSRLQQGFTGGAPTVTLTKLSTWAHTPSFRVSLGHFPVAGLGPGFGLGLGTGGQLPHHAVADVKSSRLRVRRMAMVLVAAIFGELSCGMEKSVWGL